MVTIRGVVRVLLACFLLTVAPRAAWAQQTTDATAPVVSSTTTAVPAAPAPHRAPAPFQWSGFYLGGSVGYGGGQADTTFLPMPSGDTLTPNTLFPDPMGWTYGFYGGINFGRHLVTGIEADWNKSTIAGDVTVSPFVFDGATIPGTMFTDQSLNWYSTVRGRFGVATTHMLFFATGGLAFGGLDHDSTITGNGFQFPATDSGTQMGWTIGGGVEGAIASHLAWRAQYLYLNLGETTTTGNSIPTNAGLSFDYKSLSRNNVFNGGITFKF